MNMNANRKIIIGCIVAICAVGITVFLSIRGNSEKNKTTEIPDCCRSGHSSNQKGA